MNNKSKLTIMDYGSDPLSSIDSFQAVFLRRYLRVLGAKSVLIENSYFDRDYLSEFSAFYGISSKGYPNTCKRLHFFGGNGLSRDKLRRAANGSPKIQEELKKYYLGFTVVRPIPAAPLGRTVVIWYTDKSPSIPRVANCSRMYFAHVAGIELPVYGLAWQQQDSGVGACATICLWSMFHSSAFDDHHAIPTTAQITMAAHKTASLGSRIFPSSGLQIYQLAEAIKEQGLAPVVIDGDNVSSGRKGFSRERFASSCASLLRSGYPVIIIGDFGGTCLHALCATGFREAIPVPLQPNEVKLADSEINYLYIHDDNIGPNVRYKIDTDHTGHVCLELSPPPTNNSKEEQDFAAKFPRIFPSQLVVAVHEDLRTSPDVLHEEGIKKAYEILKRLNLLLGTSGISPIGLTLSTRFMKLASYMGDELSRTLDGTPNILGRTRLALCENVPPMSLHVGLIRIALGNATPLIDIIHDTTDSNRNHPVFAKIIYHSTIDLALKTMPSTDKLGISIKAY